MGLDHSAKVRRYLEAGYSVIPLKSDKRPALKSWKQYQEKAMNPESATTFSGANGIGLLTGYAEIEALDFDVDKDNVALEPVDIEYIFETWKDTVSAFVDTSSLVIQRTPSGGFHILYKVEGGIADGNQKLAFVPANNRQKRKEIIETRGAGGYVCISPTPSYELIQGDLLKLPVLTLDQRNQLLEAARDFDKMPSAEAVSAAQAYKPKKGKSSSEVIQPFNEAVSPQTILERNGYTLESDTPTFARFLAPDSQSSNAGVIIFKDKDPHRVYSHHGNDLLADGHAHDAFSILQKLECGDDLKTALDKAREELGLEPFSPKPIGDEGTLHTEEKTPETQSGREVIVNRQIKEVVSDLVSSLKCLKLNGNPAIYQRGNGLLVEMQPSYELREVTKPERLKALLHDHFEPIKETESGGTSPASFTNNHTALLVRKTDSFPTIKNVSDVPLMLSDGTLLLEPGFHKEHGYFLNTAGIEITAKPVGEARALFIDTFNEFSYQAPQAGFTATLAFILQPFLMPLIDDLTPLYAVLGSRRAGSGTGKGYLLDCIYRIHKGKPYTHDGSMPATNEEMGKVLFSALSEGVTHVIFDDIEHLKHRELMAAITSRHYKGRILGASQRHEVSAQVTWAVTGNAPDIQRDFYRRTIPIYMGIGKARAWERHYQNTDIHREILDNRNLYLSAVISILTHWREAGMPLSTKTIKGFDRWSAVMGGVLESIDLPHLLESRDGLDELIEVDTSDLDLLIDAWQNSSFSDVRVKCKTLVQLAKERDLFTEMCEARSESAAAGELGKYLKPFINDVFGQHYLRREFDTDSKTWRYFLDPVPEQPQVLTDVFNFQSFETAPKDPRSTPVSTTQSVSTGVSRGSKEVVSKAIVEDDALTFDDLVGATEVEL